MIDAKRMRVAAGEVNALVAQIIGTHYPKGINQEALERGVMDALEEAKRKLTKLRGQLTPPEGNNVKD